MILKENTSLPAAKERTGLWNSIPDINKHRSRIGYRNYWNQLLKDNGIEL